MIVSIAAAALAVQLSMTPGSAVAPVLAQAALPQTVQYRVPVHPPPCGHGWDLSARDGMCYPNGYLPPQDQAARQYQRVTIAAAATPCRVGMARTSIAGTVNATRPERSRRSIRRGVGITATVLQRRRPVLLSGLRLPAAPDWRSPNCTRDLPERYGRRSSATASATTATSEAMVYGFGSHPSGA